MCIEKEEELGMPERQRRVTTEVFVGGVDREVKEEDVRAGEIIEVWMVKDERAVGLWLSRSFWNLGDSEWVSNLSSSSSRVSSRFPSHNPSIHLSALSPHHNLCPATAPSIVCPLFSS